MSIATNLEEIRASIPENVTLVAVSKTKPNEAILEAYEAGQRVFGENKVQELAEKATALPKDIEWHMIGHVQTNKIKYMAPFVTLVHGVDRIKVLKELNKEAAKNDRVIDCLLQVFIADEETKFGFSAEEVLEIFKENQLDNYKNIRVRGLMGMATFTDDQTQIASEFAGLKSLFENIKQSFPNPQSEFNILSRGMSGDYQLAIANGSTMIRVGTKIFGGR